MRVATWLVLSTILLSGCTVRTPCETGACAGCCTGEGECLAGDATAACGQQGAQCVACAPAEACVAGACRAVAVDGGADAGFAGTLWMVGTFVDPMRLDVARVSERLGVSELFVLTRPDGGYVDFGYGSVSDDGEWLMAIMNWEDPARFDLYVLRPDRTGLRRVVSGEDAGFAAAGGVTAGHVMWVDHAMRPFVTPLDGGATIRLLPQGAVLASNAFLWAAESPDSRYVTVVTELTDGPGSRRLWVTDTWAANPMPVEVLTRAQVGGSLATRLGAEGQAVVTAGQRVIARARFDGTSGLPFGLPDGGVAARLVSAALDGTDVRLVENSPSGDQRLGAWGLSRDGTLLAWAMAPGTADYEVYVMAADGAGGARRISSGTHQRGPWLNQPLVFSPDNRFLAFTANWDRASSFDPWVLAVSGGAESLRFAEPSGATVHGRVYWSPDSRHLGFTSDHLAVNHEEAFFTDVTGPVVTPVRVFPVDPTVGRVLNVLWTTR